VAAGVDLRNEFAAGARRKARQELQQHFLIKVFQRQGMQLLILAQGTSTAWCTARFTNEIDIAGSGFAKTRLAFICCKLDCLIDGLRDLGFTGRPSGRSDAFLY